MHFKAPSWCNFWGVPYLSQQGVSPSRPPSPPPSCGMQEQQGWGCSNAAAGGRVVVSCRDRGVPRFLISPSTPPLHLPPIPNHPPSPSTASIPLPPPRGAVTSPRRLSRCPRGRRRPGGGVSRAGTSHTRAVNNHPSLPGPSSPLSPLPQPRPRLSPPVPGPSCPFTGSSGGMEPARPLSSGRVAKALVGSLGPRLSFSSPPRPPGLFVFHGTDPLPL